MMINSHIIIHIAFLNSEEVFIVDQLEPLL